MPSSPDRAEFPQLQARIAGLREEAMASGQRRALLLTGSRDWCSRAAQAAAQGFDPAEVGWIGDQDGARRARGLLGRELELLIFDAHAGFDPDAFGAAVGAVRGGGLLVLLGPPFAEWPAYADPEHARIAVAPYPPEAVTGRFLQRLVRVLGSAEGVAHLEEGGTWRGPQPVRSATGAADRPRTQGPFRSEDQQRAVLAVEAAAREPQARALVLTSDRGRGKSAALGIAAARLLQGGLGRILVTGPRLDAAEAVFTHAGGLLPGARVQRGRIRTATGELAFLPPDALCLEPQPADLLLVEEAAAIPAPMLERLLQACPRIVFATTVHGYEGTGRGFALRFHRVLDARAPGWRTVRLETPVRWAAGDPVEALVYRALLLDAAAAPDALAAEAEAKGCAIDAVDRDALVRDEATLGELFGLLVLAHYRTRPYDLRHLLDGPNLGLLLARHAGHVIGAVLFAEEGGLDAATAEGVFAGRRRLRGHLLPQSLAAHGAFPEAAERRHLRILRIAVHPAAQGRGLGTRLIVAARDQARRRGCDLLGASFGATPELLRFWARAGLLPVRIGFTREHTSGTHSVIVLQGLSGAGEVLCGAARERLARDLPHLREDVLHDLPPVLLAALEPHLGVPAAEIDDSIAPHECRELEAFAFAQRGYGASLVPIRRLVRRCWSSGLPEAVLSAAERRLVEARVLRALPWPETVAAAGLGGRAEALALLRQAIAKLLRRVDPPAGAM